LIPLKRMLGLPVIPIAPQYLQTRETTAVPRDGLT
jgi:hypothetical protein